MEFKRKALEKNISLEISTIEKSISHINVEIGHMRQQTSEFAIRQVNKLRIKLSNYDEENNRLEIRLEECRLGKLDDEILIEEKRVKELIRQEKTHKLMLDKKDEDLTSRLNEITERVRTNERKANRESKFNYRREYSNYMNKANSLPNNLKNKLETMPYNKGIIFKGIWFYGKQDPEYGKPQIMIERNGNHTYHHVYTGTMYRLEELSPYVQHEPGKKRPKRKQNKILKEVPYVMDLNHLYMN